LWGLASKSLALVLNCPVNTSSGGVEGVSSLTKTLGKESLAEIGLLTVEKAVNVITKCTAIVKTFTFSLNIIFGLTLLLFYCYIFVDAYNLSLNHFYRLILLFQNIPGVLNG
jgi:hypothetical protein